MSVYLRAPFELLQTTVMLPNPSLRDLRQKQLQVNIRNSINGTFYSYKKSNTTYFPTDSGWQILERYKLDWEFELFRGKADELLEFIRAYSSVRWWVIDWKERNYRMYLINDPTFTCNLKSQIYSVRLELEGEEIACEPNQDGDAQP